MKIIKSVIFKNRRANRYQRKQFFSLLVILSQLDYSILRLSHKVSSKFLGKFLKIHFRSHENHELHSDNKQLCSLGCLINGTLLLIKFLTETYWHLNRMKKLQILNILNIFNEYFDRQKLTEQKQIQFSI